MSKKNNPRLPMNDSFTDFLLYTTPNGKVKVEIFLRNETVWLTQEKIAQLFGVQRPAITKHMKNIFESGELQEELVSSILEHTTQHGAIEGKTQSTASQTQIHQKPSTEFQSTEIEEDVIRQKVSAKLSQLTLSWPHYLITIHDREQVIKLILALDEELSRLEIMNKLKLTNRAYFVSDFIQPAINENLIEMTLPDKPQSKQQKYRLTAKGKALKEKLGGLKDE